MAAAREPNPALKPTASIRPPRAAKAHKPKEPKPTNEAERRVRAIQLAEDARYAGVPRCVHMGAEWVSWVAPSRSRADVVYRVLYDRRRDLIYCTCPSFGFHLYCTHAGAALTSLRQLAQAESEAGQRAQAREDRLNEEEGW